MSDVLDNFYTLQPVIRETIIYLKAVLNDDTIKKYRKKFIKILSSHWFKTPFINLWVSHLLASKDINIAIDYDEILTRREIAFIALRRNDTTWIREYRDKMDLLNSWEKRAVLFSNIILPYDEMKSLVESVASSGDIVEKSIASYLISKNKGKKPKKAKK